MKINSFDRDTVKTLRIAIEASLFKALNEKGLKATVGTIRFNPSNMRFRVEVIPDGVPTQKEQISDIGLTSFEHFNRVLVKDREITLRGTKFKVVGYNARRFKFPFDLVRVKDGKRFKAPARDVKIALGISMPI